MKQKLKMWFVTVSLIFALCGCSQSVGGKETSEPVTEMQVDETNEQTTLAVQEKRFSCSTLDKNGELFHGFYREMDDIWYLFVPSSLKLADVSLLYQGEITEVSCGELNQENSSVEGAFEKSGDQVILTGEDGIQFIVKIMQSDLPSIQIDLNDTTLDVIHQDKDKKFKENTVTLIDADGDELLAAKESVEMKGRGNSTWRLYDKKGYQIKFDEKTDVMGMGKAKKWVLLANASDDSMIRNKLVSQMAEQLDMAYVTEFEYVDLWVEGEYLGTYLIGEKVEIGGSRLNLEKETGALFEQDEAFYEEEDYWFYSAMLQRHFVLKEIVEEKDVCFEEAMKVFEDSVDELAQYLYETPSADITLDSLSSMIDVDSFVKYYLINEYVLNQESFATSFYWYKDGVEDVIHLGPIWDFDTCMGNDGAAVTDQYGHNHVLFRYLLAIPEFHARTVELYEQYQDVFASMETNVKKLATEIRDSAEMNYLRWDVLGTENLKDHAESFHVTFDEAVQAVENWLSDRNEHFVIPKTKIVTSLVSEDGAELRVFVEDENYDTVRFAVWNRDEENALLQWFEAKRGGMLWEAEIDLTSFGTTGMYQIDAYESKNETPIASGCNLVSIVAESMYQLDVQVTENSKIMKITLKDKELAENVLFAVWSVANSHDDLQWVSAERNAEGFWEYQVEIEQFHDFGEFCIDAYENQNGTMVKLNAVSIYIEESINKN